MDLTVVELGCSFDTEVPDDCDCSVVPPLLSSRCRRSVVSGWPEDDGASVVVAPGAITRCDGAIDVVAGAEDDSEWLGVDDEGVDDEGVLATVDCEDDEGEDAGLDAWVELVGSSVCRLRVGCGVDVGCEVDD